MNHHTYNFRSRNVIPRKNDKCPLPVIQTKNEFQSQRLLKTPVYEANVSENNLFYGRDMVKLSDKYYNLSTHEVNNTFDYIFNNFKKGIFIQVYKNTIETFSIFNNSNFVQKHLDKIKVDLTKYKDIYDMFSQSSTLLGLRPIPVSQPENWYMNNSFIRYDNLNTSLNIPIYYDMFLTLQNTRDIPDLEFFVNKRDNPILSTGPYEPYFHLFGSRTYPLINFHNKYTPIMSTSKTDDFADVLIPTHDDWCRAVYQETGYTINFQNKTYPKINLTPWDKKIPKLVFRGTTTGAGTTSYTNQRLNMLEIIQNLPKDKQKYFDVGFVKWNIRPRKHESSPYFDIIKRDSYPTVPFMSPQEQSSYKYILNIEGHVSAFRLGYEMSFKSVIFLVDSEWKLWFSHMIHPWIHYVPVKANLSNLVEMIIWCESNQDRCQTIAQNALDFYNKYLGTKGILDYLQQTMCGLKKVIGSYVYPNDWLPGQIRAEYNILLSDLYKNQWLWYTNPTSRLGIADRNYNILEGVRLALQGSYPIYTTNHYSISNGDLTLAQLRIGSVNVEEVRPLHEKVAAQLIHAAYVSKSTNSLLRIIPNFRFMFGILNPKHKFFVSEKYRPYKPPSRPVVNQPHPVAKLMVKKFIPSQEVSVYQESLPRNETLLNWLSRKTFASGTSDMTDLFNILIQVNLALQVAQNKCAFMHCNLVPEMIRLIRLNESFYYQYPVNSKLVISIKTTLLPIISDYRSTRVIVSDKNNYLADHNYPSEPSYSFKSSKVIDSLTLLIATLQEISNKVSPKDLLNVFNLYLDRYNVDLNEYHLVNKVKFNIRKNNFLWKKELHSKNPNDTPMTFVNFVLTQTLEGKVIKLGKVNLSYTAPITGNPIAYCFMLLENDRTHALRKCINYLARQTFPKPKDPNLQLYVQKLQESHLKWLADEVQQRPSLIQQFTLYKKFIDQFPATQHHIYKITFENDHQWVLDLPYNQETLDICKKIKRIQSDYITTLDVITKMIALNINKDYFKSFIEPITNSFDFISSVGKLNSLISLATN